MKFRDYFAPKQILFAIFLILLMVLFAIHHANTLVQVDFGETDLSVSSSKYSVKVAYSEIVSAELVEFPDSGEKVADTFNDDLLRTGVWKNDAWGEYIMCCYMETEKCIVLRLADDTTVVFSHKSLKATTATYEEIQTHLQK